MSFSVSCENDDTDFSDIINNHKTDTIVVDSDTVVVPPIEVKTIEIDSTALVEDEAVIPTDETDPTYEDYVENAEFKHTIYINFSEEGNAQVTGNTSKVSATVDGNHVVIKTATKKIEYILTGCSSNGSLKIYSEYKFKIALNGVTLTNPTGAAINNQCGKTLYMVVADGTTNRLEDGANYTDVANEDMKGTLFSEGQIIFSGKGTLNVVRPENLPDHYIWDTSRINEGVIFARLDAEKYQEYMTGIDVIDTEETVNVEIINASGAVVGKFTCPMGNVRSSFAKTSHPKGLYLLRIQSETGKKETIKTMK